MGAKEMERPEVKRLGGTSKETRSWVAHWLRAR